MTDAKSDNTSVEKEETSQNDDIGGEGLIKLDLNSGASDAGDSKSKENLNFERPEDFPDEFWDSESNMPKITDLYKAYQSESKQKSDLRSIISKGIGKPAESLEDYKLELDDGIQEYIPEDDVGIAAAKEAALDAGMPAEMFNKFVNKYISQLKDSDLIEPPKPELSEEEQEILQKAQDDKFRQEQLEILGEEGKKDMEMLKNEMIGLYKKGSLSDEDVEAFQEAAYDAKGVRFLSKLIKRYRGEKVIPTKHSIESGILTREELDAMAGTTDPVLRKKRSEGYKRLDELGML